VIKLGRPDLIYIAWIKFFRHELIRRFICIDLNCEWQNSVDTNWSPDLLPLFCIAFDEIPRDTNWSRDLHPLFYIAFDEVPRDTNWSRDLLPLFRSTFDEIPRDTNWSRDLHPLFCIAFDEVPRDTNWSRDLLAAVDHNNIILHNGTVFCVSSFSLTFWSPKLLEPSGLVQACNGIALPYIYIYIYIYIREVKFILLIPRGLYRDLFTSNLREKT